MYVPFSSYNNRWHWLRYRLRLYYTGPFFLPVFTRPVRRTGRGLGQGRQREGGKVRGQGSRQVGWVGACPYVLLQLPSPPPSAVAGRPAGGDTCRPGSRPSPDVCARARARARVCVCASVCVSVCVCVWLSELLYPIWRSCAIRNKVRSVRDRLNLTRTVRWFVAAATFTESALKDVVNFASRGHNAWWLV